MTPAQMHKNARRIFRNTAGIAFLGQAQTVSFTAFLRGAHLRLGFSAAGFSSAGASAFAAGAASAVSALAAAFVVF